LRAVYDLLELSPDAGTEYQHPRRTGVRFVPMDTGHTLYYEHHERVVDTVDVLAIQGPGQRPPRL
jgi:hypothetical protein